MKRSKLIISLFFSMMKIGLFTVGGGFAMLSLLENEFVEKKKWLEKEEFLDLIVIAESTPGPIAVNAATYIGYKLSGVTASVAATLGVCLPSFVILFVISQFFDAFLSVKVIALAFKGIRVCVIYLILSAGMKLLGGVKKTPFNVALVCSVLLVMTVLAIFAVSFSAIYYILICGTLGVLAYFVRNGKERTK